MTIPAFGAADRELYPAYDFRILKIAEGYENHRGDQIVRLESIGPKDPFGQWNYGAYFWIQKNTSILQQLGFTRKGNSDFLAHGYVKLSDQQVFVLNSRLENRSLKPELLPDVRVPIKLYKIQGNDHFFYVTTSKFYPAPRDLELWMGESGKLARASIKKISSPPLKTWAEPYGLLILTTDGSELYLPVEFSNHPLKPTWKPSGQEKPTELERVELSDENLSRIGAPLDETRPQLSSFCDLSWKRSSPIH